MEEPSSPADDGSMNEAEEDPDDDIGEFQALDCPINHDASPIEEQDNPSSEVDERRQLESMCDESTENPAASTTQPTRRSSRTNLGNHLRDLLQLEKMPIGGRNGMSIGGRNGNNRTRKEDSIQTRVHGVTPARDRGSCLPLDCINEAIIYSYMGNDKRICEEEKELFAALNLRVKRGIYSYLDA